MLARVLNVECRCCSTHQQRNAYMTLLQKQHLLKFHASHHVIIMIINDGYICRSTYPLSLCCHPAESPFRACRCSKDGVDVLEHKIADIDAAAPWEGRKAVALGR